MQDGAKPAAERCDAGFRLCFSETLSRLFVRRTVKMMSVGVYHFTPTCPLQIYVRLFTANIALRHAPPGFGSIL